MRKHILGFALFALILSSAICASRLIYPTIKGNVGLPPQNERAPIRPPEAMKDIYTVQAASVVVDVNERKVYVSFDKETFISATDNFAKAVIFAENSNEVVFETEWLRSLARNQKNLVFSCDDCAAMSHKKNYYARVYYANAPSDTSLKYHLENEAGDDFSRPATSVLVNSGKVK